MLNPFLLNENARAEKPGDKGAVASAPFTCSGLFGGGGDRISGRRGPVRVTAL